jgi:hypothetical protein
VNKFIAAVIMAISFESQSLDKTYNIRCFHEFNVQDGKINNFVTIDSQLATCFCGNPPCFVFISFGKLDCYCLNHVRLVLTGVHKEDFNV